MKKLLAILILTLGVNGVFAEDSVRNINGFTVAQLSGENVNPSKRPFTITNVQQTKENLILWISASNIGEVSRLLNSGRLETQSAIGEEVSSPPLSLWKQVTCSDAMGIKWTSTLGYSEAANCPVISTRYYFIAPVILSNGRNFGIGLDPDYLWLIEKI